MLSILFPMDVGRGGAFCLRLHINELRDDILDDHLVMGLHINELRDDILDDHLVMVLHINELRDDILDDHLVIFHVGVLVPNI